MPYASLPSRFTWLSNAALLSLDKDVLAEHRSMPTPPESVCLVVAAVSSIVDKLIKVSTMRMAWMDAKKVLLHPDKLLITLQKTGVNSVNAACIAAVEDAFINNDKFVPEKIEEASVTAAKLCQWVTSFVKYYRTILSGLPVQAALHKATHAVETANSRAHLKPPQKKKLLLLLQFRMLKITSTSRDVC